VYTTEVEQGQNVRLRLISHSTNFAFWFSIDNHTMEMVEIDGVEVEPIATTRVFINPGQRYSVVIAANQTAGNYFTRATAVTGCFHLPHTGTESLESIDFEARGILSYKGVDAAADPIGKPWRLTATRFPAIGHEPWMNACGDLPLDRPKPTRQIDAYEVGPRNNHYFEFRRSKVDSTMRTYVNEESGPVHINST
jgi:FtsP/CotA-like multicopper oxidase with cupredoxin domain